MQVAGVLTVAAPLGMPSGKNGHQPGWNPLQGSTKDPAIVSQAGLQLASPCRLPHVGSLDPLRGDGADFGSGLHRQCTATQAHTLPSVSKCVWRDTVRQRKIVLGLGLGLGVSEYIDIFSAFPKVVH